MSKRPRQRKLETGGFQFRTERELAKAKAELIETKQWDEKKGDEQVAVTKSVTGRLRSYVAKSTKQRVVVVQVGNSRETHFHATDFAAMLRFLGFKVDDPREPLY